MEPEESAERAERRRNEQIARVMCALSADIDAVASEPTLPFEAAMGRTGD